MYEKFKNQFILKLTEKFEAEQIIEIVRLLDILSKDYDIIQKERSLIPYYSDIPEVVKIFIACKKIEGYSKGTLINYKNLLMNFFRYVDKPIEEVSTNDIRIFLYKYQEQRKISNRTLSKYQENLKAFFTWCYDEGYTEKNVSSKLSAIKYEVTPRQSLSQLELEEIRNSCESTRERAIIEFIYSTGCRVSELCDAKKSDIDWNEKSVHLFGKGSKHRTSFINAKAEYYLKQYLETRNDNNDYLFVSERFPHDKLKKCGVEKIIRGISNKSDLNKNITPHVLRHTTATTALTNGMPINEIQKILGHESVNTTMIYAKTDLGNVKADHKKYII